MSARDEFRFRMQRRADKARHWCSEVGNATGGYECECGGSWKMMSNDCYDRIEAELIVAEMDESDRLRVALVESEAARDATAQELERVVENRLSWIRRLEVVEAARTTAEQDADRLCLALSAATPPGVWLPSGTARSVRDSLAHHGAAVAGRVVPTGGEQ